MAESAQQQLNRVYANVMSGKLNLTKKGAIQPAISRAEPLTPAPAPSTSGRPQRATAGQNPKYNKRKTRSRKNRSRKNRKTRSRR